MAEGRFVTDTSLEGLARRLRLLGYDVASEPGAVLEDVCRAAGREDRIVLTRSRRVPRQCAWVERVIVPHGEDEAALRSIAARWGPSAAPFTRCTRCNVLLGPFITAGAAPVSPPSGVRVTGQCPACHRCYWEGSHVDRLRTWLAGVLGDSR